MRAYSRRLRQRAGLFELQWHTVVMLSHLFASCCVFHSEGEGKVRVSYGWGAKSQGSCHQMFSFIWGFLSPVWRGGTHFCFYVTCSPGNATFTLCFSLCSVLPNVSRPTTENHYCCLFIIKILKIMASICSFPDPPHCCVMIGRGYKEKDFNDNDQRKINLSQ